MSNRRQSGDQCAPGDPNSQDPRSILNKPRWQRLIVAAAGPFMNVVLAIAVLAGKWKLGMTHATARD